MDDPEEVARFPEGSPNRIKQLEMYEGTDNAYRLARELGIRVAFGTDILNNPAVGIPVVTTIQIILSNKASDNHSHKNGHSGEIFRITRLSLSISVLLC